MWTNIENREDEAPYAEIVILTEGESNDRRLDTQAGKIGWAILWLLGVPLPILLVAYLIWGR